MNLSQVYLGAHWREGLVTQAPTQMVFIRRRDSGRTYSSLKTSCAYFSPIRMAVIQKIEMAVIQKTEISIGEDVQKLLRTLVRC
jgi:hypothetical protein